MGSLTDGTSNTVMMSEAVRGTVLGSAGGRMLKGNIAHTGTSTDGNTQGTQAPSQLLAEYQRKVPPVLCKPGKIEDSSPLRYTAAEGKNEWAIDVREYKNCNRSRSFFTTKITKGFQGRTV
ncbi:MAG: DUF1559 domain-containing protein [Planctomycetaceae bacterium]|nr:DUF1559 domain-containing protein [Planctomycetaceae bacterium]